METKDTSFGKFGYFIFTAIISAIIGIIIGTLFGEDITRLSRIYLQGKNPDMLITLSSNIYWSNNNSVDLTDFWNAVKNDWSGPSKGLTGLTGIDSKFRNTETIVINNIGKEIIELYYTHEYELALDPPLRLPGFFIITPFITDYGPVCAIAVPAQATFEKDIEYFPIPEFSPYKPDCTNCTENIISIRNLGNYDATDVRARVCPKYTNLVAETFEEKIAFNCFTLERSKLKTIDVADGKFVTEPFNITDFGDWEILGFNNEQGYISEDKKWHFVNFIIPNCTLKIPIESTTK